MIHKKRKKKASFGFSGHIQGRFRPFSASFGRFRPVSAVSATGRYDPIWPIRPDIGRISPVRRKSSRIGTNRAASARIQPSQRESEKKKKKRRREPTHEQPHRAASNASMLSRTKAGIMGLLVSTHESFQKNFQEIHLPGLKMNRCNTRLNPPPPFQPKTYLAQQIKQSLLVHMVICFFNIKLANHTQ